MAADVWPEWATERVEISAADPGWPLRGERERDVLMSTLAQWLVGPVVHVGSTSVPGLAAKPILDYQGQVIDLDCAPVSWMLRSTFALWEGLTNRLTHAALD